MRSFLLGFCLFLTSLVADASDRAPGLTDADAVLFLTSFHVDQTNFNSVFVQWNNKKEEYEIKILGKVVGISAAALGAVSALPGGPGAVLSATWCFVPKFWSLCQISLPMFLTPLGADLAFCTSAYFLTSPIYNCYAKVKNSKLCDLSLSMLGNDFSNKEISFDDYPEIIPYVFNAPPNILASLSLRQVLAMAKANPHQFEELVKKNALGGFEQSQAEHYLTILKMSEQHRSNVLHSGDNKIDRLVIERFEGNEMVLRDVNIDSGNENFIVYENINLADLNGVLKKKIDIYFMYNGIPSHLLKDWSITQMCSQLEDSLLTNGNFVNTIN